MAVQLNGVNIIADHLITMGIHSTLIFPATTEFTCTLTAHADAHTWSAWAEVVDSDEPVNSLSTPFASNDGHVTAMITHDANQNDTDYRIQLAYGAAKVAITSWGVRSGTGIVTSTGQSDVRGTHIPAGETIYYRCMCGTAAAKTLTVHFRYFVDP